MSSILQFPTSPSCLPRVSPEPFRTYVQEGEARAFTLALRLYPESGGRWRLDLFVDGEHRDTTSTTSYLKGLRRIVDWGNRVQRCGGLNTLSRD